MSREPSIEWRREIGGETSLPAAWLLEVGPSVVDPAARLALAAAAVRAAVGCDRIDVTRSPAGALVTSDPKLILSTASRHGCLAIALAQRPVGIDVEMIKVLDPIPLAVLHPVERAYVDVASPHSFFALWTAKEAYWKLVGLGFGHGDESVSIIPDDDTVLVRHDAGYARTLKRETATLQCERGVFFATCLLG